MPWFRVGDVLIRNSVPFLSNQKCIVLNVMDTVWTAKQVILDKIYQVRNTPLPPPSSSTTPLDESSCFSLQELTLNPLNYGLYLPATGKGKMGKFMNDSNLLIEYALEGKVPKLEVW